MKNNKFKTSIGGQAVIEGVMMRGPQRLATSVRKPDGEIVTDIKPVASVLQKNKFLKLPIMRGCVSFVESLVTGVRCLMFSAEFFDTEEEQPGKFDLWLEKKFGDKLKDYIIYFSVALSLVLSIGLFIMLPAFIAALFKLESGMTKTLLEGTIRILLFIAYLALVSQMNDIKRVFMYHGAEHKSIACFEAGMELTPENARGCSRFHPRCGTSFLLIVMLISILFFMFIRVDSKPLQLLLRLVLIPVIAGVSFEFIRLAGRYDNWFMNILSQPGLWMQRLTTKEPDDDMIEVGIASVEAVFDWKAWQKEEG